MHWQHWLSFEILSVVITVMATATMAVSGVIQAVRHDMDLLGAAVLALITAVGGGTVRDVLLGATPVFWLTDLIYLSTIIPISLLACLFAYRMKGGAGRRLRILGYIDALGLGLFTLVGVQKTLAFGLHPGIAIIMGCVTGTAGGMIRDLLCGEPPVLLKQDLYATLSLVGGLCFILAEPHLGLQLSSLLCIAVVTLSRVAVLIWPVSLPSLGRTHRPQPPEK